MKFCQYNTHSDEAPDTWCKLIYINIILHFFRLWGIWLFSFWLLVLFQQDEDEPPSTKSLTEQSRRVCSAFPANAFHLIYKELASKPPASLHKTRERSRYEAAWSRSDPKPPTHTHTHWAASPPQETVCVSAEEQQLHNREDLGPSKICIMQIITALHTVRFVRFPYPPRVMLSMQNPPSIKITDETGGHSLDNVQMFCQLWKCRTAC